MRVMTILLILAVVLFSGIEKPERELPEIIPLYDYVSYRVKWETWVVSKEFIGLDSLGRDSVHKDAVRRLKVIELNYKP